MPQLLSPAAAACLARCTFDICWALQQDLWAFEKSDRQAAHLIAFSLLEAIQDCDAEWDEVANTVEPFLPDLLASAQATLERHPGACAALRALLASRAMVTSMNFLEGNLATQDWAEGKLVSRSQLSCLHRCVPPCDIAAFVGRWCTQLHWLLRAGRTDCFAPTRTLMFACSYLHTQMSAASVTCCQTMCS